MIAGHFGLAAAVKSRVPSAPTWALMLASVWMDVLFVPLLVAGVEKVQPFGEDGKMGYGQLVIHADVTHSLLGALVIAGVFGAVCTIPWGKKLGAIMAAMVFAHWVLDLPMHHHDMPLLPQNAGELPRLGFGLWSYPAASALLELALVALGTWLYWRRAATLSPQRARLPAIAMALAGVITLALNVAGQ